MSSNKKSKSDNFEHNVATKEKRRIRAERRGVVGTWSAFGAMGVIGWTVAIPAVLGSFLGGWMDYNWPGKISWTLTMLGVGLSFGCVFAGIWMNRERGKIIHERDEDDNFEVEDSDIEVKKHSNIKDQKADQKLSHKLGERNDK